jgi:hypothetical protein
LRSEADDGANGLEPEDVNGVIKYIKTQSSRLGSMPNPDAFEQAIINRIMGDQKLLRQVLGIAIYNGRNAWISAGAMAQWRKKRKAAASKGNDDE